MALLDTIKSIRLVVQVILLMTFYFMTFFYVYQRKRKRARWEVLYIAFTAGMANTLGLAAGDEKPLR